MKKIIALMFVALIIAGCTSLKVTRTEYDSYGKVTAIVEADYSHFFQNKSHELEMSKDNTDGSVVFEYKQNTDNDPTLAIFNAGLEAGKKAIVP